MTPRTIGCFGARCINCRRPILIGAGCFSAAAAPASRIRSAAVRTAVRGISRIHLIAPTAHDFHDVNLEDRREERESNLMRVKEVSASRGEAMHAEPISLLYGKGRMLRRRGLDQLEAEMMAFSREWDRAVG
jgi:phage terminase large subunit-like protein